MEAIVINQVPPPAGTAKPIVIDLMPTPPFTAAVTAKYYWRFDDEPDTDFQYLGQQTVGSTFAAPFEGSGRSIVISQIGVAANGVQSAYDPREGKQTTILLPSVTDNIVVYDGEVVTYEGEVVTYG